MKDQVVPTSARSYLPKEMQTFLKVHEMKKQKEDISMRLDEYRKEYETLAINIKTKNIQHISLQNKRETLKSRVNILEFKSKALDKQIKQEEKNKELIIITMPIRLTAKNASETLAMDGVKQALRYLDDFYTFYINQASSPTTVQEAKDALWIKMRKIFSNIPNFIFFNVIMRLKDEQLQNIMSLINKSNTEDSSSTPHSISGMGSTKEPLSAFEIKLLQTKADLLGMVAKYLSARKERIMLEEHFSDVYNPFVEELKKKVNLFNANADNDTNEMISDYLVQYNLRNFTKSENDFLTQQIEQCKTDIDIGARQLENHEVILGSIKQVYSDINTSINRIQHEMLQLGQIKEKILYSKNMLKRILDDMQMSTIGGAGGCGGSKSNFQPTKLKVNNNISTIGDSFEMVGGDMVFCSTKLDFDSTIMSLNSTNTTTISNIPGTASKRSVGCMDNTLMPVATGSNNNNNNEGGRFNLPPYLCELSTFAEIPFEKFSCITRDCAYHLSPNPLIVETRELSSTIQLAPGSLLTASGALQEVRNRIKWADLIAQHSLDLKLDLDLIMVDAQSCRQKMKQHREQVEELLDKIDVTNINTNRTLPKLSKLYNFILANPLRHYIPSERNYSNQTYADYEAEYAMYHRMATVGASIK